MTKSKEIVSKEELQLTPEDIRKYICKDANDKEIKMFLELCKHQNLNPFIGDVYLVKYGTGKAEQIVGRHLFNKRADAHPQYDGMKQYYMIEDPTESGNQLRVEIESGLYNPNKHILVGAITEVYRKDRTHPLAGVAYLKDFDKDKATWKTLKLEMILKVSEVLALRKAFPQEFQGMYIKEELGLEVDDTKQVEISKVEQQEEELDDIPELSDTKELEESPDETYEDEDEDGINLYGQTLDLLSRYERNQDFIRSAIELIHKKDKNVALKSFKDVVVYCAAYKEENGKYPFDFMNK